MKKITLFIAFLAISIGAVWGEEYPVLTGNTTDQNLPFSVNTTGYQHIQMIYPASYFKNEIADPTNNVNRYKFEMNFIKSLTFTAANNFTAGEGMITSTAGKLQISDELNCTIKVATISSQSQYDDSDLFITDIPNPKEVVVSNANCVISGAEITISLPATLSFSANDNLLIDIVINSMPDDGTSLTHVWLANNSRSTNQALYQQGQGGTITSSYVLPALKVGCSRKLIDVTSTDSKNNTYTYDVFSYESGSNFIAYVVLKSCIFDNDGHYGDYYINPSTSYDSDDDVIGIQRGYIYIIPSILPATFIDNSYSPSVTKLSNNLSFSSLRDKSIIVFPEDLVSVGDNEGTSNTVFDGLGGKVVIFPATSNNVPPFVGSSSSASTTTKPYLFVYDNCGTDINTVNGWQGSGVLDATNRNYGWCSHPYDAKLHLPFITNPVEISNQTSDNTRPNDVVKISQHPFQNTPIEIQITSNALEKSNDGTTHYYSKFTENSNVNPADYINLSGKGTNKVTAVVNITAEFDLYLGYYAEVKVDDGNPTYANGDGGIMKNKVFNNADSLVFRYTDETEVPHWTYTGDKPNGSAETIPVNTQIRVEKKIDNLDYHYFSLPFACKVSDIEVRYFSDNSYPSSNRNQDGKLELLTTDLDNISTLNEDYFIIQKYNGQAFSTERATYTQIKDINEELEPYKGYAFAVIESDNHYHGGTNPDKVEAMIVFKSDVSKNSTNGVFTNLFGSTTYSGFKINNLVNYTNKGISNLNRGWNLVGNPFYFPIKGNSYGGNKYFARINNSVGVHYLEGDVAGEGIKVIHIRTDIQTVEINPFEAIFLQVPDDTKEVEIDPYPAPQVSNSPSTMGSAINSMPEHLSVKITDANNVSDRTTVINMAGRDTSFVIGDDFAKMMNPGAQIYSWFSNVPCVFKELPLREDSSYIVPLGVIAPATGNYTFALDTSLTLFYGAAMLHDKQMNQYHPLNEEGVQISLNKGTDNARFELVIVPSEIPADVENVETSETLDAYVYDGRLVVENIEAGSTLSIFDITGRMLYSAPAVDNFNYQFSAHGVYMVVLQGNTTGSIKVVY